VSEVERGEAEVSDCPGIAGAAYGSVRQVVLREPEDDLLEVLDELQLWLVAHPVAARGIVRALVSEGRRFAETPGGRRWATLLQGSELVRRGRIVWDSSILSALDARDESPLPSAVIDTLLGSLASSDLRIVLERLASRGLRDD